VRVPGALNSGDGGGKDEGRSLGCGLEKRPPCTRLTELGGDAPPFRAGSFTFNGTFREPNFDSKVSNYEVAQRAHVSFVCCKRGLGK